MNVQLESVGIKIKYCSVKILSVDTIAPAGKVMTSQTIHMDEVAKSVSFPHLLYRKTS